MDRNDITENRSNSETSGSAEMYDDTSTLDTQRADLDTANTAEPAGATGASGKSGSDKSDGDHDRNQESRNDETESTKTDESNQQSKQDKKIEKQEKKNAESSAKTMKKLKNSEKSVKRYQFFFIRLIIILIILWVLFFKVIGITHMPNGDMYPRIDQGDFILYYRLDKNFKAQDVVVIEKITPESNGKKQIFVCRVVAVAGDTVEVTDNQHLIINGNTMVESNIFYQTPRYEGFTEYPITLKEGEIFVLADMRNGGHDSRYFGPVTKDEVIGTVITILRRNGI